MGPHGIIVPAGQDPVSHGRSFSLKLRGGETGDSIAGDRRYYSRYG
jgi:hypothetical protein